MRVKSVTIITLTYNNFDLITSAISSVFVQELSPEYELEYLIVDDCSKYFDGGFILDYVSTLKGKVNTKIIRNPVNIGTVKSFNNAIKNSNGDIIIPLSADDMFNDCDSVSRIIKSFDLNGANVITALRDVYSRDLGEFKGQFPISSQKHLFNEGNEKKLLKKLYVNGNIISGANTYYRREYLLQNGLFDEGYVLLEDYPFYIKVLEQGDKICLLNEVTIIYRDGGVSTNKKNKNSKLSDDFDKLYKSFLDVDFLSKKEKKWIFFSRILSRNEKMKFSILIKYFDMFVVLLCLRIKSFLLKITDF